MNNQGKYTDYSEASLRLDAIFETATDGIISIDENGCMELVNSAAAKLFGYELEEMIGRNVQMLMPFPHRETHDQYIHNYLSTGLAKIIGIGREVSGIKKDGSIFPLRLSISEVQLKDRRIFTGILHDLSQRKEAEKRIIKLNAELEQRVEQRTDELAAAVNQLLNINKKLEYEIKEREAAEKEIKANQIKLEKALKKEKELNELKSRFVSMASHEFRTPLSTILSSADLIEAYTQDEQQSKRERHTSKIKSAVANLTGILNDFLSLSKLEEGNLSLQKTSFNLHSFCELVQDELQGLLKPGQNINHHGINDNQEVNLDKKFLKNILFNLLSNAIKYSNANQPIDCNVEVTDTHLHIAITDYGIGIPEEEQQHLFTRFFRAHNVENIQGTGLGLNIVKRYVDLMEGQITFESRLGVGTTFRVVIPLN